MQTNADGGPGRAFRLPISSSVSSPAARPARARYALALLMLVVFNLALLLGAGQALATVVTGRFGFVFQAREYPDQRSACSALLATLQPRETYDPATPPADRQNGNVPCFGKLSDGRASFQMYGSDVSYTTICPPNSRARQVAPNPPTPECECDPQFVARGMSCVPEGAATASAAKVVDTERVVRKCQMPTAGQILESAGVSPPGRDQRNLYKDEFTGQVSPISASARSSKAMATAIRADMGEAEAYKQALARGEIGLQRPMGANVRGADFITARIDAKGAAEIIVTDVKTTTTGASAPAPKKELPGSWAIEVDKAVERLSLGNKDCEDAIRSAHKAGSWKANAPRQIRVNYADESSNGQAAITGWGDVPKRAERKR
jgi:hypothetical protein